MVYYPCMIELTGLEFKDVYLIPQYSEIETRSQVDIGLTLPTNIHRQPWKIEVPVISSNMDTVTGGFMAKTMFDSGGLGALHRFMTIEENLHQYSLVRGHRVPSDCFVSVGVNRDSKERTQALYDAGARYFVIDIAHGHSKMMKDMITWIKGVYPDVFLMAGNVATGEGSAALAYWGADAVKVGIGPGAVCLTKNVTGVTVPQLGAIQDCARALSGKHVFVVADGGIREYGDVAKAIAAGADLVMIGGMFAGTDEAPGELINGKKVYRGMASRDAMRAIRVGDSMPTPEGASVLIDSKGPVKNIVQDIAGGLRSAFSYSNARNMQEFWKSAKFGIKRG